jgi:hypothetical protein
MRHVALTTIALSLSLITSPVFAQNMPAQSGPQNRAVKGVHENNSSTPVSGANSFTMKEAKSQIEAKGYTNITKLKKDKKGVWRGIAKKDGVAAPVSVDYQGNVN